MGFYVYAEVWCNGPGDVNGLCGNAYSDQGTPGEVRQQARQSGWLVSQPGGHDYCSTTCRAAATTSTTN
ncbi:hypothetical protein AB0B63_07405 [Micromonospora sp. NPDC049081]|uniref:hypothetical protein n=1 Tax=Micromonospora sp. NPDC049081 TaxID=3155150 RepID=UPI0033EC62EC